MKRQRVLAAGVQRASVQGAGVPWWVWALAGASIFVAAPAFSEQATGQGSVTPPGDGTRPVVPEVRGRAVRPMPGSGVLRPPAAGTMPVIRPPATTRTPVITPPKPAVPGREIVPK